MAVLVLPKVLWERVVAHCLDGLPMEACGLLAGVERPTGMAPGALGAASEVAAGEGAGSEGAGSEVAAGEGAAGEVAASEGAGSEAGPIEAGQVRTAEAGAGWLGADGERRRPQDLTVAEVREVYPAANAARSARLYTVEPRDLLRADRAAEKAGWSLVGVWHSHTHSPAYPSPTDIAAAPDPLWHYVVVSLSDTEPVLRSYRIVDGQVLEEPVLTPGLAARELNWWLPAS